MGDQAEKLRQISQSRILRKVTPPVHNTRVITVTSGKGGVGKTNFTINLAIALIKLGKRVVIIDADLGLANIDVVLGITPQYDLNHVFSGKKTVREVITQGPEGIKFIAGGTVVKEIFALKDWQIEKFINSISDLEEFTDIILIDTGAGISQNVLSFVLAANEVIVVTTPEPTAVADAYGIIKVTSLQNNSAQIKLVVNRAENVYEAEQTAKKLWIVAERFLNIDVKYLGYIFNDPCVSQAVKKQQPFLVTYPNCEATKCIYQLAKLLCEEKQGNKENSGIKGFLDRMTSLFR